MAYKLCDLKYPSSLAGVAQLLGASSLTPKNGWFDSQSEHRYTQLAGSIPGWGACGSQLIKVSLCLSLK